MTPNVCSKSLIRYEGFFIHSENMAISGPEWKVEHLIEQVKLMPLIVQYWSAHDTCFGGFLIENGCMGSTGQLGRIKISNIAVLVHIIN